MGWVFPADTPRTTVCPEPSHHEAGTSGLGGKEKGTMKHEINKPIRAFTGDS